MNCFYRSFWVTCALAVLGLFSITSISAPAAEGNAVQAGNITGSGALAWVKTQKIKATYTLAPSAFHRDPEKVINDLKQAGFNAIILAGLKGDNCQAWISAAKKNQIHIFDNDAFYNICDKPGQLPEFMKDYRKVVYKDGTEGVAPCPLDETYWNNRVLPGLLETARLSSQEKIIAGFLIDTEMYGVPVLAYLEDTCFCDDCFRQFLISIKKENLFSIIAKKDRHTWLNSENSLKKYSDLLEQRLENMAASLRIKAHAINPELILGNLNYVDTWFFRGLAKGLGTPAMPALVGPESPTYFVGYTSFVDTEIARFKNEGFHVLYVPGIWDTQFFPDDLAWHCYNLATHSDGYWDFTVRGFYEGLIPEFYAGLMRKSGGSLDEYWRAFAFANQEINKNIQAGGNYSSPLSREIINLAKGKMVTSTPMAAKGSVLHLTDGVKNFSQPVSWELGDNDKVILLVDLGSVMPIRKVRVLFQGGGSPGGLYFPRKMEVYSSVISLPVTDSRWDEATDATYLGDVATTDTQIFFPENGWYSAEAFRTGMTVRGKKSTEAKFVKIVIYKQADADVKKITKIKEEKHRFIMADEIEISRDLVF